MTFLYNMLGEFGLIVCVFIIPVMLPKSYVEGSASLSNILFVARRAFQLIYSFLLNLFFFLGGGGFLQFQKFS